MASIRTRKTSRGKTFQVRGNGRSKTFSTREDAKRYALELDRRKQLGTLYEAPPESFGAFLDAFILRKQQNGARPRTVEANREQAHYLEPLRKLTISALRASEVEDLVSAIPAKASAGKALALLKSALRSAKQRGHAIDEAILDLRPPRYEQREARFLTLPQLYELSSWMPEWLKRIVPIAGLTGLRQGELFDLLETDLDLDEAKLEVRGGKTKAARRTVHLSGEAVRLLRAQLLARPAVNTSYVFPSKTGLRFPKDRFMARYFRPARDACLEHSETPEAFRGMAFHHTRHSAISLMCLAGMPVESIAERVGHVDATLIYKRYRHLYADEQAKAVALLDALVSQ